MRKFSFFLVKIFCIQIFGEINLFQFSSAKTLKNLSSSRKSSPSRTPVKKQTKVPSLLDPSRLKPPPTQIASSGGGGTNTTSTTASNLLGPNSRINYGLGMQNQQRDSHLTTSNSPQSTDSERQQQSPPRNITLHLDANEIITVTPDSSVI